MKPAFRIIADANDVTTAIRERFLSLTLNDDSGQESDSLEIRLDDADFAIVQPRKGVALTCALGYQESGLVDFGVFVVDEVSSEGPPCSLTIRARAANLGALDTESGLKSTLKSLKTRSWDQTTLGAVVAQIAGENGYEPKVAAALADTPITHSDQTSESDIAFLSRLVAQYGAIAKPVAGYIIVAPAASGETVTGQTLPTVTLYRHEVSRWSFEGADREFYRLVRAWWQDLDSATRQRVEVGEGSPVYELTDTFASQDEAAAVAAAKLAESARGKASGSITLVGRTDIVAETPLQLVGFRDEHNGAWRVKSARHTINANGYTTSLELESPE